MRVCIATTNFPRWQGDFRVPFIYEAARAIHEQGHFVRVVTLHNPGAQERETMDGMEVIRLRYLPERWEILQKDAAGIPSAWKTNPAARLAIFPFAARFTQGLARYAVDCDLIHANWTLSGAAAWASKWLHHRPYLVTVQGSDIFTAPKLPLVVPITRHVLNRAARVLALSQSLAIAAIHLGVHSDRIQVVPNGVNVERFPFHPDSERDDLIVFIGSMIERKGVRYLLQGMKLFLEKQPQYRLVLIGEGPQREEFEQLAQTLQINERVLFTGTQSQEQVSEWLRKARLFVLPSIEEGQGVVLVEALASGTPCLGTTVGGIPDVVTEDVGIVVPPADAARLSAGMIGLLSDRENWLELSEKCRKRAEEVYDWRKIASLITDIYEEVRTQNG